MNSDNPKHQFLWLDVETTGLDPQTDTILELACALIEDGPGGDFEPVDVFELVVCGEVDGGQRRFRPAGGEWIEVHATPWQMHADNGLWKECAEAITTVEILDASLHKWLVERGAKKRSVTLAGNSVHFDLGFIRRWLPKTAALMSHRVFDVSTLIRAAALWAEEVERPPMPHRALEDVLTSIEIAKACRASLTGVGE